MHKSFNLSGDISLFEEKSAKRMGRMKQSTILPVTLTVKNSLAGKLTDKCAVK